VRHLAFLAASIFLFAGCSGSSSTKEQGASPVAGALRLGMVTDVGGLGDKSFNDSAYAGLKAAQVKYGAKITVLQSRSATDYEPNLSALAQQGNALVVAIGFLMHDSLNDVAPRYPQTHFGIIDSVVDQPNVTSVTFKEEESSFLAGALAGLVTKKDTVGFLGGIDSPLIEKFLSGYEAGVVSTNPKAKVLVKYTGSFDDVAAGKEYATVLFDQGADIVYAAAGKCGLGAIDEVKARPSGYYVIGVDSNQDAIAPGRVLTSALKRVDRAVLQLVDMTRNKKTGGHLVLGLKDGGVGLTDFKYTRSALPAGTLAALDRYKRLIIAGQIVVPSTPAGVKSFIPPRVGK
jgi:basic membrane protein A